MSNSVGKPIFKQRLYGSEEVSSADTWGKTILGRRNSQYKVRRRTKAGQSAGKEYPGKEREMLQTRLYAILRISGFTLKKIKS